MGIAMHPQVWRGGVSIRWSHLSAMEVHYSTSNKELTDFVVLYGKKVSINKCCAALKASDKRQRSKDYR